MGPPDFPDHPVPTWEEFCEDYQSYYFDVSRPTRGKCFIIMAGDRPVGQINYNEIDRQKRRTELDIWMGREVDCGKGYGPDALEALSKYLFETFEVVELVIRPSARNRRAIRAYAKAGFQQVRLSSERQETEHGPGDYEDSVLLIKRLLRNGRV
jgi:diamine N-acetyltransferase